MDRLRGKVEKRHLPFVVPSIITALGGVSIVQTYGILPWQNVLEIVLDPSYGGWVIAVLGVLTIVSVFGGQSIEREKLSDQRRELENEKQQLMEDVEMERKQVSEREKEVSRLLRLTYRPDEFPEDYNDEPIVDQTQEGYVVYAGDARSDDVYVVFKDETGSIQVADEAIHRRIKDQLENEAVNWMIRS